MIRVLIVEDEYLIRTGLKTTVNWGEYGYEIVGEAVDGMDGVRLANELKPELIITDVCMPKMTGLEMIEKLNGSGMEFIILTGHQEFSFVQKALENGVSSYLLKPIKNTELVGTLLKIRDKIVKKQKLTKVAKDYENIRPELKKTTLTSLLLGQSTDSIENIKDTLNLNFEDKKLCVLASESPINPELFKNIETVLIDNIYYSMIIFDYEPSNDFIVQTLKKCESGNKIGVSQLTDILAVNVGYHQSLHAMDYLVYRGENGVLAFENLPISTAEIQSELEKIINIAICEIADMPSQSILDTIDEFFLKSFETMDLRYVKKLLLIFVLEAESKLLGKNSGAEAILGSEYMPNSQIENINLRSGLRNWTKNFIGLLINNPILNVKMLYRKEIQDAIAIIQQEFATVTIEQVADKLYLSSSYLMHLFKKEVGATFNEYLVGYKIEKAKQLLKTGNYKVYEISEMMGYKSTKYFSLIFKRETNMTPKEYVEKLN